MASFTSAKSGNWSALDTWTDGSAVPGDGDVVTIGAHTVTIDQDIGTSGNGIKNIILNNTSAVLTVDTSAARTILFGSTGSNPIGSGTAANPGADASMYGLYVARGTLNLVGTSTNRITINSGGGVNPWYIRHGGADLGNINVPAKFTIQYCDMTNLGTGVTGFEGIHHERADGTNSLIVEHCTFTNFRRAVRAAAPQTGNIFKFNNNTGTGNADDILYFFNVWTSLEIKNNTFSGPTVDGKHLAQFVHGSNGVVFEGNSYISTSSTVRCRLVSINSSAANCVIKDNELRNSLSSSSSPVAILVQGTGPHTIEGNIIVGSKCAFNTLGQTLYVKRNFFYISSANLGTSHSPLELSRGNFTVENNIVVANFTSNVMGLFAWDTSETGGVPARTDITSLKIYYNTFINIAAIGSQGGNTSGIAIGQGGDPVGGVEIVGNITYGWRHGIRDTDPLDQNEFVSGRVSNNLAYACENGVSVAGATGGANWNGGGLARTGNPNFANAGGTTAADYYILTGGDGINQGETTCAPSVDFVGTTRDATPDIGAYEFVVSDAVPPTLTSATATATGATTATGSVTTDEANGTLYFLASGNATESAATIKAALSQAVTEAGEQSVSLSALDAGTTYYVHFAHVDAASNESNVVSTASFTTGAVTDSLTGQNVAISAPTVTAPTIAQVHALTAQNASLASPTVSSPALSIVDDVDDLAGQNVAIGAPSVTTTALGQIHVLGGDGVALGAPTVSTPAISQVQALSGQAITITAPTVSVPALSAEANTDPLTAQDVEIGNPSVSYPAIAQAHTLAGDGVGISAPTVSMPVLGQIHVLMAQGVVMGAPTVSMPGQVMPITAAEVARIVSAHARAKTVIAQARQRSVRYAVSGA